jgi:hypothetical protein
MSGRLNIVLIAAAALTLAAWSVPAAANGQRPSDAAVSQKSAGVAAPKKARRAAVQKRIASATLMRRAAPPAYVPYRPYERLIAHLPFLVIGVGY